MVRTLLLMALIGIVAWLLVSFVPMPGAIATAIIVAAVIMCVVIIFRLLGVNTNSLP